MPGTVRVFVNGKETESMTSPFAKTEDAAIAVAINSDWNPWNTCHIFEFEAHKLWVEACAAVLAETGGVVTAAR